MKWDNSVEGWEIGIRSSEQASISLVTTTWLRTDLALSGDGGQTVESTSTDWVAFYLHAPARPTLPWNGLTLPTGFKAGDWPPDPRQGHSSGDPAVCWASTPYWTCNPRGVLSLLMAAVGFVHTYVSLHSVHNPKATTAFVLRAGRKEKCRYPLGTRLDGLATCLTTAEL